MSFAERCSWSVFCWLLCVRLLFVQCASTLFVQGMGGASGRHAPYNYITAVPNILLLENRTFTYIWTSTATTSHAVLLSLHIVASVGTLCNMTHLKKINYGIGMRTFRLTLSELWFDQWWKHTTSVSKLHKFDFFLDIDSICDVLVLTAVCFLHLVECWTISRRKVRRPHKHLASLVRLPFQLLNIVMILMISILYLIVIDQNCLGAFV